MSGPHATQRMILGDRRVRRPWRLVSHAGLMLIGLAALLISACAPSTGQAPLAKNQLFIWPYTPLHPADNSIQHDAVLDPAALAFANDSGTIGMLYQGLVTFDSQLQPVPGAATWDVDGGGTIYTFHLNHNLKFSDGSPLTAADYAYSIDRAMDPHLCTTGDAKTYVATGNCVPTAPAYLAAIIGAAERSAGTQATIVAQGDNAKFGLNVIDQYTLRIRLTKPVAYFLEALTYPSSYPVEKSLVQKYPGGTWVDHLDEGGCSGPFMVKSYDNGKQLRMVPNPYWGAAFGKQLTLQEVDRPYYNSIDAVYKVYRQGQLDFTPVPPDQYTFARGEDDFNEVPTLATQYFGLNFNLPPFDNQSIRVAFDLALNKQYLIDSIAHGAATPTNHIVPRGMPGYNEALVNPPPDGTQSVTGNQDAARKLIDQAVATCATETHDYCPYITGNPKQPIVFYVGSGSQSRVDVTKAATQQWTNALKLNVTYKVDDNTWGQCVSFGNTLCQAWAVGWLADYPDPQDWLSLQFASTSPYNTSSMKDKDLDALFAKADIDQNVTSRMQEYNQAEQAVVNFCAWIPYDQDKQFWRQRSWVHGFGLNALQLIVPTDWAKVYVTAH